MLVGVIFTQSDCQLQMTIVDPPGYTITPAPNVMMVLLGSRGTASKSLDLL